MTRAEPSTWEDAVRGLKQGDFSALEPLFRAPAGQPDLPENAPMVRWHQQGRFAAEPEALAEALTCACFNGCTRVAEYFLDRGVDLLAGNATGLNALHWAANRGQVETLRLLLERCRRRADRPLESLNMYGGTVLGCAAWSAVHEPRPGQMAAIEALLEAGANAEAAEYPSGSAAVDDLLRRYRKD